MKMTFNLNEFWYGVRQYKGEFDKKYDNTIKNNVPVRSSNISQNDETIKILKILKSWPIFLALKMTFNLNKFWHEVGLWKKYHDDLVKDNVTVTS